MKPMVRWLCLVAALNSLVIAGGAATAQQVFRSYTQTVAVHATVTDRAGRPIMDLSRDDFEIFDNGQRVVSTVFSTSPQPLTLLMMFDTSASIAPNLDKVRVAARTCISALIDGDRARIGTLGHEIAISPHLTGDKTLLTRVIREEIWPGSKTRLWDGLRLALSQLANEKGRRALIVLSDGRDSSSLSGTNTSASRAAVRSVATADDWTVYAVNVGTRIDGPLVDVVDDTGGRAVRVSRASELAQAYAGLMEELRHQYLLGFSAERPDGTLHRLEVRVRRLGLTVRSRRTYQADPVSK